MSETNADQVQQKFRGRTVSHIDLENAESSDDDSREEGDLERMNSRELAVKADELKKAVLSKVQADKTEPGGRGNTLLANHALSDGGGSQKKNGAAQKKGAFGGVFVPTCENMWGVLIFLRFFYIVGHAGVLQALCAVFLSFSCAFCTTSSMSATVSSGGFVSKGGPYYMISRALGPCVGASVGVMYWLAMTMLAVLETLGAVEGVLMAAPHLDDTPGFRQIMGSAMMIALVGMVWVGISFVSKMGLFFVLIVFFTLFSYYYGLIMTPLTDASEGNPWITGLSYETLSDNWSAHYGPGVDFGSVLSVFFPCFTGILSGANRADVLRDPPKNLRQGTFGAIIFSLFLYSSFMVLWGMVADYRYLQGMKYSQHVGSDLESHRRLAGGDTSAVHVVTEIVWNPFPNAAIIGIIVSSLSQALQCLIVAPRLLQKLAADRIIPLLNRVAPLSGGEPKRALLVTYLVGASLVLMGKLNLVAPLLSMCFLVAYANMNLSCFMLTILKSTTWRPKGIHHKRWRIWYLVTSGSGTCICLWIMFTIDPYWALAALFISMILYLYMNYKIEQRGWGSAMDGIRFQLALGSLLQLEGSQVHRVNWRPQILILYRIRLEQELKGIKHHEILRFYSHLRKARGFCIVACVLEADCKDESSIHKAEIEKGIIKSIMKEEKIDGFSEVVVAPSWAEGANYIIQLTGIGGLTPNTVLLEWPRGWRRNIIKAKEFTSILNASLASKKAVIAMKGLSTIPNEVVHGTIDIWWMIHDGGFLILLSWLLVQHRIWRKSCLRVFSVAEGVSAEQAKAAGVLLTKVLRQRRLFDVEVEVIIADDAMLKPYSFDGHRRSEDRHKFLEQLHPGEDAETMYRRESIPLEIQDLFKLEEEDRKSDQKRHEEICETDAEAGSPNVSVCDVRKPFEQPEGDVSLVGKQNSSPAMPCASDEVHNNSAEAETPLEMFPPIIGDPSGKNVTSLVEEGESIPEQPNRSGSPPSTARPSQMFAAIVRTASEEDVDVELGSSNERLNKSQFAAFRRLNDIILSRSKRAQLVVMNLPDQWGSGDSEVRTYVNYIEMLTSGIERVMFVHSAGNEVFDMSF
eukprot:TRINITY_DN3039_c0_g1_i3.p1 TRINITY_DN3039_c0_g1~~TRINITY_DN3039_c0_g1_i3.p1  ORF type:complete len:1083 (-),score=175.78 TRINITY_DN3039_c0_g1_i3:36-3284(-)